MVKHSHRSSDVVFARCGMPFDVVKKQGHGWAEVPTCLWCAVDAYYVGALWNAYTTVGRMSCNPVAIRKLELL